MITVLPADQRVVRRVEAESTVNWIVPRRHHFRATAVAVPAQLVNVSVTGLGITADAERLVAVGSQVLVVCDGMRAAAEVRRVSPAVDGRCYYALEMVNASPSFIEAAMADTELDTRTSTTTANARRR